MKSIEARYNELVDENQALTRIINQLKNALHQKQIECAAIARQHILTSSGLSETAIARLNAAFRTSTDNAGLKEGVHVEAKKQRFLEVKL